jgi:hypothetical protein
MVDDVEMLRDDANYYGDFGKQYLSNSDISTLLKDPSQYGVTRPDNQNFAKGRYFHQLILEPSKAENVQYVNASTRTTKVYKQYCEDNDLPFALLESEVEEIQKLVTKMLSNYTFFEDIRNDDNVYEVPAIGKICGLMWKGKADIVHPDMLIDLKTTSNIDDFKWSARRYNYDSQAYIYQSLFGKPLVFYAIEKATGRLGIYRPTEDFLKRGEEKVVQAVEVWKKFFADNASENINDYYIEQELI